jgi:hypothetical protein
VRASCTIPPDSGIHRPEFLDDSRGDSINDRFRPLIVNGFGVGNTVTIFYQGGAEHSNSASIDWSCLRDDSTFRIAWSTVV